MNEAADARTSSGLATCPASQVYEPNTPSTLTVYLARPAAAQHHARPAICSVAVSRLPIFNDSHGTSYLKICRTDLCQILGSVELRL